MLAHRTGRQILAGHHQAAGRRPIDAADQIKPRRLGASRRPTITEKRRRGILNVTPFTAGTSTSPSLYVLNTSVRLTTGLFDGAAMAASFSERSRPSAASEDLRGCTRGPPDSLSTAASRR